MNQSKKSLPKGRADGNRRPERVAGFRRAFWMLLAASAGIAGYLVFGPQSHEMPLEAGSGAPITHPIPEEAPAPEPPPIESFQSDSEVPDTPPAWSIPGEEPAGPSALPGVEGPSYVGPRAPAFTGSPAPTDSGLENSELFGHPILGLHPELLRRLRQVELTAPAGAAAGAAPTLGVEMIVAFRKGSQAHSQGRAVDINYYANPYIMHEQGEAAQDERLAVVYHRIARMLLGRDSVIPTGITEGAPEPSRTLRLYHALRDESRAMIAYFRLMQDREALARFLAAHNPPQTSSVEAVQRQMAQDYVTLSGRSGPAVPGLDYPSPEPAAGDPPFAGDPVYRGPEMGFLNLSEELVRALTDAGLRWGGTDMGANSGDLMHFYLPVSETRAAMGR